MATASRAWHEIVVDVLKANDVRLIPYVPDNVLKPLIAAIHADPFFHAFTVAREEEARRHRRRRLDGGHPRRWC